MNFVTALQQRRPSVQPMLVSRSSGLLGMDRTSQRRESETLDESRAPWQSEFAQALTIYRSVIGANVEPLAKESSHRHEVGVSELADATIAQSSALEKWARISPRRYVRDEQQRIRNADAIAFIDALLRESDQGTDENVRREWEEMKASLDAHRSSPRKLFP